MCSDNSLWPAEQPNELAYQDIETPNAYKYTELTKDEIAMKNFFDNLLRDNNVNVK